MPQQALFFLNHPLVIEAAKHLLARAEVRQASNPAEKLRRLYRLAFGREPSPEEIQWAEEFTANADARPALWQEYAQGLLAANEFVFVD